MAEKILKSLTFPGINTKYIIPDVPEVDSTLSIEGAAADSKAVGEHIANKDNPHSVTAEQIGATYTNTNTYNVTSDSDVVAALNAEYALTPALGRRNFILQDNVGISNGLAGGVWQCTLYRVTSDYGSVEAVRYSTEGIEKRSRSLYGGNWTSNWEMENNSGLKIRDCGNSDRRTISVQNGWYRLATISPDSVHTGSFILSLGGTWWNNDVPSEIFLIQIKYCGATIKLLDTCGVIDSNFNIIRIHQVPGDIYSYYIDCHYRHSYENYSGYNITPLYGSVSKNNHHEHIADISGYTSYAQYTY